MFKLTINNRKKINESNEFTNYLIYIRSIYLLLNIFSRNLSQTQMIMIISRMVFCHDKKSHRQRKQLHDDLNVLW